MINRSALGKASQSKTANRLKQERNCQLAFISNKQTEGLLFSQPLLFPLKLVIFLCLVYSNHVFDGWNNDNSYKLFLFSNLLNQYNIVKKSVKEIVSTLAQKQL